ncbi:MAG: cytochrome b subunit of the bc complex [Anaerolineae bacterium]
MSFESEKQEEPEEEELLPFLPNYLLDEVIAWYAMLAILVVLASLLPAGLEEKADPFKTPPHVKPEWYFLSLYQTLKLVPRVAGVLAPVVGIGVLFFLPFLDRSPETHPQRRPLAMILAVLAVATIISLTIWGHIS